ncbi:tRNA selenocysteine 1-associated protein 1-like isoform X1 [Tigriopus californicus]|uniref:tRNA selenocysteine 1-associated protein 1-like isoform X1 n=1 Tax=Tigriopus californicus TaxID=6832 RepID=UPI0027DA79D9|nr:tRNA selenocysteine 1-associated protein 1-like isoform X1 [Tigriopus californicus]
MDEDFIRGAFAAMGETNVLTIKIIKNKFTGEPASYGFVNFDSDPSALMAMHKLNGKIMPNSQPPIRFKLNHNSTRLMPGEKDHSIWVGDLSPDVDDLQLYKFFSARFQTVKSAKVVLDGSGFSKGYGFIRFGNEQEQNTALMSMMGVSGLGAKPIKVSLAVPKWKMDQQNAERGEGGPPGGGYGGRSGGGGGQYNQHHHQNAPSSGGSITDHLPASALAMVVSNASGNPNAGAAMVAEAQSKEYAQMWQQYYKQQWEQYAAWNEYSSQYAASGYYGDYSANGQEQSGEGNMNHGTMQAFQSSYSIFEGDDEDLVEHSEVFDTELINSDFLSRSEELWSSAENSRWVHCDDENEECDQISTSTKEQSEESQEQASAKRT